MPRIVTTMTVIPSREESIIRTVQSIKDGSVIPDAMYCNIPKKYMRFEKILDPNLRSKLIAMGVTVIDLEEDRACLNKVLPILQYEKEPETIVITMDDDMSYTKIWVEGLVLGLQQFGGVVGYSGMIYPETVIAQIGSLRYSIVYGHGNGADILENGFGTAFRLESILGFPEVPPLGPDNKDSPLYLSDDYVMARFFDSKDVPKRVICWPDIGRQGDDWSSMCKSHEDACEYTLFADGTDDATTYQLTGTVNNNLKRYIQAGKIFKKYLKA
jgi:hypothetical protein